MSRSLTGTQRSDREEEMMTDPRRGDSLCVCIYCGVVFVAEMVANDILKLKELKARDVFAGQACVYCNKSQPALTRSEYRLVIGPLRPPMMEKQ